MKKSYIAILTGLLLILSLTLCACNQHIDESTGEPGESTEKTSGASETEKDTHIVFTPASTGIFVRRDGSLQTAEITSFDNSSFDEPRYTEEGLRQFVEETVSSFNAEFGKDAVRLEKIDVSGGEAMLILTYASAEAFLQFQGTDFGVTDLEIMSVADAIAKGIGLSGMRTAAGASAAASELYRNEKNVLVRISGKTELTAEDEILYFSDGQTLEDAYSLRLNTAETVYLIIK